MNTLVKKTSIVFLLLFVTFFFSNCEKLEEENRPYNKHVDLTIDGKEYRNSRSILPPLKTVYPIAAYRFTERSKFFSLTTDCVPKGVKEIPAEDHLELRFYIFLDQSLEVGRKYDIQSIPDFVRLQTKVHH